MKSIKIYSFTFFLLTLLCSGLGYSQNAEDNRVKTLYSYTLGHIDNPDELEKIKSEIESLLFVEKVKINSKSEKPNKGQLLIYVNEPIRTSENQQMFEPTELKKIIFKNDIELLDLKIAKY